MASGPGQGLKRALQDEMENGLVLMILKVADEVWCFFFFEQKKKKNRKEREGGLEGFLVDSAAPIFLEAAAAAAAGCILNLGSVI